MKTLEEYYSLVSKYSDVESISAIWSEINNAIKELEEIKKLCLSKLESHLRETGEAKVKTHTATIGWTQPKPKKQLNQSAWEKAVWEDEKLYDLVQSYEYKRKKIEIAQQPYIEEVTPESKFYIR